MASPFTWLLTASAFMLLSFGVNAQQPDSSNQPPQAQSGSPPQAQPSDTQNQPDQKLSQAQLDQLVAPIALYPDPLLSTVLMASTYPLEVIEASRWAEANKSLKGNELKAAVDKQAWDDSVKELTATPAALAMMSDRLDWMQKLGDAVLAQQPDVMDAVQRLRVRAQAENKLMTTKEQTVSTRTEGDRQAIVIEPADPNTISVPYYDPNVVYGAWPYANYPPYFWAPPVGYWGANAWGTGLAFTAGFAVGAWATNDWFWGGGFGWGDRNIFVRRTVVINNRNINNRWTHNSAHRHGVRYSNNQVARRYNRPNDNNRNAINRGRENAQPARASDRVGDRNRQTNRANASNRNSGKGSVQRSSSRQTAQKRSGVSQQRAAQRSSSRVRSSHVNRGGSHMRSSYASRGRASFGSARGGGGGHAMRGGGGGRGHGGGGRHR